jgi:hypothetical protein
MNKIFCFLIILFAASNWSNAQILNSGFEQWTDGDPDGWYTNNDFTTTITPSGDHHSGTYSVKGEVIVTSALGVKIPIFPFMQSISGITSRGRYNSLSGYYKFSPNNDSIYIRVQMLKDGQIIGYGDLTIQDEQTGFVEFQVNINYQYNEVPDTSIISVGLEDLPGTGGDYSGSYFLLDDLSFSNEATGVERQVRKNPNSFYLAQNYPNPFNPSTKISYSLSKRGHVTLSVYNLLGQKVVDLIDEEKPAGRYEIDFNAGNLSSGAYFYMLQAGNQIETKKMILLR